MRIAGLLEHALRDIDTLEEYYSEQYESTVRHVKKEREKYKYGLAIYKYLCGRLHEEEKPHCMSKLEEQFIAEEVEIIEDKQDKKNVQYKLRSPEKYEKYELDPIIADRKVVSLLEQSEILNDSVLIMLQIKYENIISEIYKELLKAFPDAYLKEKSIAYSKLMSLNSDIGEIKNAFIESEIDEFMRRPLKEWYEVFEQKHKLHFEFGDEFDQFKEIYYRRNIVVHNKGIANSSYIEGVSERFKCDIGTRLSPTESYLNNAFDSTRIVLVETFLGITKLAVDVENVINKLFLIGYDYMQKEKWIVSKYIFRALDRFKGQSEADKWCNTVNFYVSCKNLEGIDSIRKEAENMDTSLMKPRLAIAKPALLNDNGMVSSILEKIIGSDISVNEIKTWPLLLQYRESEDYKDFIYKHSDLFEIESCSTDDIACLSEQKV
ncbi:MAG: hypothetical protein K5868_02205 [Lachnospiraceae bacterium]|nr:hypothetical protein [Lachnospiraceae bacterium]